MVMCLKNIKLKKGRYQRFFLKEEPRQRAALRLGESSERCRQRGKGTENQR
jgi:hypothetical protein